nr:phage antirepressor protein [Gammaproteobacteria bacterium]
MRTEHITSNTLAAPRFALSENVARNGMSSLELREIVNEARQKAGEPRVRNDQFVARVKDELGDEVGECSFIAHPQSGVQVAVYQLTLEQCMLVGMRESKAVRRAVLAKLKELGAQQQIRVPQTLPEALRLAAELAEQVEAQQQALAIAAPKAEFVDRYVVADGLMSFRQVAKLLFANERKFRQMLLDKGVMYYLGGALTPYQQHIDAGRFEVKTGTSERNKHAFTQARFTPKGVQWVAGLWASYQLEAAA